MKLPFQKLYLAVKNQLSANGGSCCRPSEVMALAYCLTVCNPWCCTNCQADKAQINSLPFRYTADHNSFQERFRVSSAVNRGKMPKFVFSPERYVIQLGTPGIASLSLIDIAGLSCSWGMFLKPAFFLCLDAEPPDMVAAVKRFTASPALQIDMCIRDLEILIPNAAGDFALAASRLHAHVPVGEVTSFGEKCQRIARQFEERGCT
jgi:hypothetical protein